MKTTSSIERLEARIAPALIIAPNRLSAAFTDLDGDLVQVRVSHGSLAVANFTLTSMGAQVPGGQSLTGLVLGPEFDGADLTITAERTAAGGDGFANVSGINAQGLDLGKVSIDGDLGQIRAGTGSSTGLALGSLTAASMGAGYDDGGVFIVSQINGRVGTLHVLGSIHYIGIDVENAAGTAGIGRIVVGGSVVNASIDAQKDIGSLRIHGDLAAFGYSSSIQADNGNIGNVKIGGAILNGRLSSGGKMGAIMIAHDVIGGSGNGFGSITAGGDVASVLIGGSLEAGSGANTGAILSGGNFGLVRIGGSVIGNSLTVNIGATGHAAPTTPAEAVAIKSVKIGGDFRYGTIFAGTGGTSPTNPDAGIGPVKIGGDFYAGRIAAGTAAGADNYNGTQDDTLPGGGSAAIVSRIARLTVGGSVGGTGNIFDSFRIVAEAIGAVKIGGTPISLPPGANTTVVSASGDVAITKKT